ncbi:MAG: PhzF family phenazine biosynthesis protein [Bacteroidales bacterium]|nr:PhzF family phenazine biosynthesis protein [Bacteroidales bacterium]MBN2749378.1 PhzF family phenazine biosynthesis protein [Bacteroidales bacterium]
MLTLPIYQVDAFTSKVFKGNSACVVMLEEWLPNSTMLNIAKENGVAETAFFTRNKDHFHLRWFTPDIEMDLCGHATLATAHVVFNHLGYKGQHILFKSVSGDLAVGRNGELLVLDFPHRKPVPAELPVEIAESLNIQPKEVLLARDYVLVYETQEEVEAIAPNRRLIDRINLDPGGVIVTSPGKEADFVSRFFTPQATIFEDPVTGSAHCSLVPLWAERLGKKDLHAQQLSQRSGELYCTDLGNRVLIKGNAVTFLEGTIRVAKNEQA